MIFTRQLDGTVTVDQYDNEAAVSLGLLAGANPSYLRIEWVGVRVHILDATYRITGVDYASQTATITKES